MFCAPTDFVQRQVDVVGEDLNQTAATGRGERTEVDLPPVVGLHSCPALLELVAGAGQADGDVGGGRKERRNGVGQQHLGGHPVVVHVGNPEIAIPVPARGRDDQVIERADIGLGPCVELV